LSNCCLPCGTAALYLPMLKFIFRLCSRSAAFTVLFAINEAAEVAIGNLYLPNIQYEDFIIDIQTGFISTYYGPEWGWFSGDGFDYILPTHTYWLYTTSPTSSAWTYTPIRETKNANNELQNTKRSKK